MASLADIRRRIVSVKNTQKITRAMKLVAAAKLRKATGAALAAKPYQESLVRVLGRVVQAAGDEISHPLLTIPENESDVLVVVISSDRGLCGGFNAKVFRNTEAKIAELKAAGKSVKLICYGKKSVSHFGNRDYDVIGKHIDMKPEHYVSLSDSLATKLTIELAQDKWHQVILASSRYISVMSQTPQFTQILPMALDKSEDSGPSADYIYEPGGQLILSQLLPTSLRIQLFQGYLEKEAGEQASRMTAMDSATRNAGDLINELTLTYNRARQAAITKELIEIVSGAEAL